MTLVQLRYLIQVAESGSISAAAEKLFIAQPSLSKAIAELESEMGVTIFARSSRGVELTEEGARFLAYARQVVEQADMLEQEYKGGSHIRRVFGVSAQHYAFVVNAFVELVREYAADRYEFSLRVGGVNAAANVDAAGGHEVQAALHHVFRQLHVRDAVHKQAAGTVPGNILAAGKVPTISNPIVSV